MEAEESLKGTGQNFPLQGEQSLGDNTIVRHHMDIVAQQSFELESPTFKRTAMSLQLKGNGRVQMGQEKTLPRFVGLWVGGKGHQP